jgi:hypothetical protein
MGSRIAGLLFCLNGSLKVELVGCLRRAQCIGIEISTVSVGNSVFCYPSIAMTVLVELGRRLLLAILLLVAASVTYVRPSIYISHHSK